MKTRTGFVSNSSSASFILFKSKLTVEELDKILNFLENDCVDGWMVSDIGGTVDGFTAMDNGDFEEWLEINGISRDAYRVIDTQ